ncbi:MAG TPA: molybdopterin molybdotransferase MoeA, partial [Candidatus Lustribacter sp.]
MLSELFTVVTPSDALAALLHAATPVERSEIVPLHEARGRVLDRSIVAVETIPHFPRALMDGFAVRAADTRGASEAAPAYLRLTGEVLMGTVPLGAVGSYEAVRIHTGAMLPPGADAVVMMEETNLHGAEVEVLAAAPPGDNVLLPGEDIRSGATAFEAGTRLDVAALGGLAALGYGEVAVRSRPRIAILSTGDELIPIDAVPRAAQVRDINAVTVAATVEAAGGVALPGGIVPDDAAALTERALGVLKEADGLVVSAGSSVSHRDVTAGAIARLGGPGILAHGIAIRPGKPTIVAICGGKPVVGLPGNPASAVVVAWRIVGPLVRMLGGERGVASHAQGTLDAVLSVDLPSRPGREEYVPCRLDYGASPPP